MTRRLFLFETRRLVRHPLVWGATVLVLALQTFLSWDQQPDLAMDPINATGLATCLAAAVLVVASLAASRDGRHGMPESLAGLPGRAEHRTRALLLATPLVAGLAAAVAVGGYLAIRLLSGPAGGRLDVWEPLTAVAAAVLAATLGVAVGRWSPWLIAGPLVVAVLGFLIYQNPLNGQARWLLPVMQDHQPDWPDRPSAVHLVYVLAVAAAFGGIALLRHRVRPAPAVAVAAALAVAVPTGATTASTRPPVALPTNVELTAGHVDSRVRERYLGPDAYRCTVRQGLTYCAFPGYEPWIPLWEQAIQPVVAMLPAALRTRAPQVRQISPTWGFAAWDTRMIRTPMSWGHPDQRRMLAEDMAFLATGLYDSAAEHHDARREVLCDVRGQARTVVAHWLIGQVSPPGPRRELYTDRNQGRLIGLDWGPAEIGYAKLLLASPGARERIQAHWDTLMKPTTTIDQALPLLGLERKFNAPMGATPCM
ncbi:hypothetical protein [Nonomuraea jiangxiensis]|uniref:Uncharacterized protein n=1 Tax=Nonomuraea jiangxiensis TaxID=633440 RepID=A0A1G8FN61_9ACTN|nr:hypothetical protein [Nonomuraea jiangxiensis]SDH83527.1 hypothetical protein SAMN05421869_103370 [Nonomuraea jiangxiensis]